MKIQFALVMLLIILIQSQSAFASDHTPQLSISLLDYQPDPVQPGQIIDLTLQVDNRNSLADDVSIYLVDEYPFTIEPSKDAQEALNLDSIGFSRKLQYRVRVAEDASDGLTPLRVRYTFGDARANDEYAEQTFDINIKTFNARIDIADIQQIPETIAPGETGKLILTVTNADDRPLNNVDVVLDLTHSFDMTANMDNMIAMQAMVNSRLEDVSRRIASGLSPLTGATPMMNGNSMGSSDSGLEFKAFALVDSTNQQSISQLRPHERVKLEFNIMALPQTKPKPYATPVYINYNDEDNNPFHVRMDVPLIVDAKPELYVDLSSSGLRTTDFAADVTFTVANRGLTDLQFVTLELDESESLTLITAPRSIYLGNLAPGESKEGKFTILADEEHLNFSVKTQFKDAYNEEHVQTDIIPFTIINKNFYRDLPYEMWLAWIILGFVVLALMIFYVRKVTKKK